MYIYEILISDAQEKVTDDKEENNEQTSEDKIQKNFVVMLEDNREFKFAFNIYIKIVYTLEEYMGVKDQLKVQLKDNIKNKSNKIIIKFILPYIGGAILVLILIAASFYVIESKIKDAAGAVVKAASRVTSIFDNKSDTPTVVISDELIEEIKKEMEDDAIDQDATYLTDALLKASLQAYNATQYPYIDGVEYDDNDESVSNIVKGCIYLKRGNKDMHYVNYNRFSSMIGDGKNLKDRDNVEN